LLLCICSLFLQCIRAGGTKMPPISS
jgi:hypothetical protein